jgi:hypothetical protein
MTLLTDQYRFQPEPFWDTAKMFGDDGWDRIERARPFGWQAIPVWGLEGWDLGSWPLTVVFHREPLEGLAELVNFGGTPTSKGDVITALRREGRSQALIDRFLQGLDRGGQVIGYELLECVEGDPSHYAYPTQTLRDSATDELAMFHWRHQGREWVEGIADDAVPALLRGPFSWQRLEESKRPCPACVTHLTQG